MDYSRFLTAVSARRQPDSLRELTAVLERSPPSMISLACGMPNAKLFPYKSATIELRNGETMILDEEQMDTALQYSSSAGMAELIAWLKTLQEHLHHPPTLERAPECGGMDLAVTIGAQDGLCKMMEALINEGDNVVIDCPAYSLALSILRPLGCNLLSVEKDGHGMKPESLLTTLSQWKPSDSDKSGSGVPRVLYTVPNGCNPTGASLTLERKQRIYQICREYNILILEDDPYYFLQFGERIPSFLSMDEDGRVMRFDSFSKILSSGLRIGFASGPTPLIDKLVQHMQVSGMHASSMSQVLVHDVLQKWGIDGFLDHNDGVVEFYRSQKDAMMTALSKHMTGLATWEEPKAGMFVWIKLEGIPDTKDLIQNKAAKKEVLLVPGCFFMPDSTAPCPYVRAAFGVATPQQMEVAMERLASLIKEEL